MSYDLKHLKRAIDAHLPPVELDEPDFRLRPRRIPLAGVLAGAIAACMLLAVGMSLMRPVAGPERGGPLAPGVTPEPAATAQPRTTYIPSDADVLGGNTWYSADYADSMLDEERAFGDVVIRRMDDGSYVFQYAESGEKALPGQWTQALAYFPATETGLVGDRSRLALLGADGLMTDYIYNELQYVGNGLAIVSMRGEEEIQANAWMNWRVMDTASGEYLADEVYHEVGFTSLGEAENLLMLCRVYREGTNMETGWTEEDLLYTDLWLGGQCVLRCFDYEGSLGDDLIVRQERGRGKTLVSLAGETLLGGLEFEALRAMNGELYMVYEKSWWEPGVARLDGSWVIEPGQYDRLEQEGEYLYASDWDGSNVRCLTLYGEETQMPPGMRIRLWLDALADDHIWPWLESFGTLGRYLLMIGAMYLALRLGMARREGDLRRAAAAEGAPALMLAVLLALSRCMQIEGTLWPTDTATDGASAQGLALLFAGLGVGMSLAAVFPRLRKAKWGALPAAAIMLLPWTWKTVCRDVSVAEWRVLSMLVFLGLPLMAFWPRMPVGKRFLAWCETQDGVRHYGRWARVVWWALALAAAVNFGVGTWFSGQEMARLTWNSMEMRGYHDAFDENWLNEVNANYEDYCEALQGSSEETEAAARVLEGHEWPLQAAVRWMRQMSVDALTEDMLRAVSIEGELNLARPWDSVTVWPEDLGADALLLHTEMTDGVNGTFTILALPDADLGDALLRLNIWREGVSWAPSTRLWTMDMGTLKKGGQIVSAP